MGRLTTLHVYPRHRREDARGFLLKLMTGGEAGLEAGIGEIYATFSLPGEARGNHFHPRTREWFTVLQGEARLELEDPETGEQRVIRMSGAEPATVEVPPGVAHAVVAVGEAPLWLIAAASAPYDPADVVAYAVRIRDGGGGADG